MPVLSFEKPKKTIPQSVHNELYVSDGGVPGTWVPNMSEDDNRRWKGKAVFGGGDPRVEIRKGFSADFEIAGKDVHCYAQSLVVVRKDSVIMSLNGKAGMTKKDFSDLVKAVDEAYAVLENGKLP